jgi:hypothetical protein
MNFIDWENEWENVSEAISQISHGETPSEPIPGMDLETFRLLVVYIYNNT